MRNLKMQCPKCGKNLKIPSRAYMNLQTNYQTSGRVLVSSNCCGYGIWLNMEQVFTIEPYSGDRTEDDWGVKLSLNK
jgi:hypothetical protein